MRRRGRLQSPAKLNSWDFKRTAAEIDQVLGQVKLAQAPRADRSPEQKLAGIRRLLRDAGPVAPGCPSWRYLERRCGVVSGAVLADLRHHDHLSYAKGVPGAFPGLLAILRYANGKGASVHRTFLTQQGFKANLDPVRKVMPGLPLVGASVRLGEAQEVLGIAEGIETALCASKLFGMPGVVRHQRQRYPQLGAAPEVKAVVVFGDNDSSFIGQAAAYDKAKDLRLHGLDVEIQIPPTLGTDWCDVWGETNGRGVS